MAAETAHAAERTGSGGIPNWIHFSVVTLFTLAALLLAQSVANWVLADSVRSFAWSVVPLAALAVAFAVLGWNLMRRKNWARVGTIVMAILLGTGLVPVFATAQVFWFEGAGVLVWLSRLALAVLLLVAMARPSVKAWLAPTGRGPGPAQG